MKNENTRISRTDIGLLAIRVILAVVFIFHGGQKLFGLFGGPGIEGFAGWLQSMGIPAATLNAYLAASAEFFGGVALLLGLATRIAVVPMIATMVVAILTVHPGAFSAKEGGMEYALTLAVVLAGIGLTGAGKLSVDALLSSCSKKCEEVTESRGGGDAKNLRHAPTPTS